MIINFSKQNEIKIDSVAKNLKKCISSDLSFTRGDLRDVIVDSVFTQLSQHQIQDLLIKSVKGL